MIRRARIQMKPNVAKAGKVAVKKESTQESAAPPAPQPQAVEASEAEIHNHQLVENSSEPEIIRGDEIVALKPTQEQLNQNQNLHRVHFKDDNDIVDNSDNCVQGQENNEKQALRVSTTDLNTSGPYSQMSNGSQFISPGSGIHRTSQRSRNVSMCEDEAILNINRMKEKKRFTGMEELDTKTFKMADLARWNPKHEKAIFKRDRRTSTSSTIQTKSETFDNGGAPAQHVNAPQVKIGADGRLVIDETSLVVNAAQMGGGEFWETVEEGRDSSKITSLSFRNRIFRKSASWTPKETDLFYDVLRCTGSDFGLMHHYLPARSRFELKAKYNKEEKTNWARISQAMKQPAPLDETLSARIAVVLAEMEEEANEKKRKVEWEKEEERRVRQIARDEKNIIREAEKNKKMEARELLKQAREIEKEVRIASKVEREVERQEKLRERVQMKMEADRKRHEDAVTKLAMRQEREMFKELNKVRQCDNKSRDSLEREAERIIRRLILENERAERRSAKRQKKKKKKGEETERTPRSEVIDPMQSDDDNSGFSSDSSETSSSTGSDSDPEALKQDAIRREKRKMKKEQMKRDVQPRKVVIEKKPVYVSYNELKYAGQPFEKTLEVARKDGALFNVADDEEFEIPGPAPPIIEDTEDEEEYGKTAPEPRKEADIPVMEVMGQGNDEIEVVEEEEEVPRAVTDVIEEITKARAKTPPESAENSLELFERNELNDGEKSPEKNGDVDIDVVSNTPLKQASSNNDQPSSSSENSSHSDQQQHGLKRFAGDSLDTPKDEGTSEVQARNPTTAPPIKRRMMKKPIKPIIKK